MPDLSQPSRQSIYAIIFIIMRFLVRAFKGLWPLLLILLVRRRSISNMELFTSILLGVILPLQLIGGVFAYFRFYYYVKGNELIIEKGIFVRTKLNIPFERIQTVDFNQSFLHRIFDVVGVQLDTAGSSGKEADIHALSMEKAEALRSFILEQKAQLNQEKDGEAAAGKISTDSKEQLIFQHSVSDLLKTGLSQNHLQTMGIVLAFLGSGLQYIEQILERDFYSYIINDLLGIKADVIGTSLLVILPILLIVSFSITLIRTAFSYYNLRVLRTEVGFRTVSGLISRQERAASLQKVQLMRWSANPLQRWVKMVTFRVFQLASTSARSTGKSAIVLPGCYPENLKAMVNMHLPENWKENLEPLKISRLIIFRRILFRGILPSVLLTASLYAPMGLQSLWFLLWIPYSIIANLRYYAQFYWEFNEHVIHTHRGIWALTEHLMPIHKVISVSLNQSPYQRRKGVFDLTLYTAAGGVRIPYVPADQAYLAYNFVLYQIEDGERD